MHIFKKQQSRIAEIMKKFNERNSPEILQEGMIRLAERGWFVTLYDMPVDSISKVASWFKGGETDSIDYALTNYFERAMPRLMIHLAKTCPGRSMLIERAYMAHRLGLYDFSVPVFLSQADGIGSEVFGISPYSRRSDAISKLREYVGKNIDTGTRFGSYWELIYSLLPVCASEKEIARFEDPLNRHEVLHGTKCDYGTRENSCKSFSWMQYVASFKDDCFLWKKKSTGEDKASGDQ